MKRMSRFPQFAVRFQSILHIDMQVGIFRTEANPGIDGPIARKGLRNPLRQKDEDNT